MINRTLVQVEVTGDDIGRGERDSPCRCPLAIALSRALGTPCEVVGGIAVAYFPSNIRKIYFDRNLKRRIYEWDIHGVQMQPFKAELAMTPPIHSSLE